MFKTSSDACSVAQEMSQGCSQAVKVYQTGAARFDVAFETEAPLSSTLIGIFRNGKSVGA